MADRDEQPTVPVSVTDGPADSEAPASEAPASAPEVGDSVGRYRIVARIGAGGMGVVYRAHDPELDRVVALKRVHLAGDAGAQARLLREARAMARLNHPHVIPVYGVEQVGAILYMAMELVEGSTLRAWLRERGRPWREVLATLLPVGAALAAAHDQGIVHRDFKPDNVLIGADGRARVGDFGLARAVLDVDGDPAAPPSTGGGDSMLTEAGVVMGTPAYMAPEQYRDGSVDPRSDQYSFAVVVFEALWGRRPFEGRGEALLRAKEAGAVVATHKAGVPRGLASALRRALAPRPEDRWPSMSGLLRALTPRSRLRPIAIAAGGAAVAGALLWARPAAVAEGCASELPPIRQVWHDQRKDELMRAILGTGTAFANDVAASTAATLDAYAESWSTMHAEACASGHGVADARELDLRIACLDDRRRHVEALLQVLISADAEVAERATEAAASLPDVAHCGDVAALSAAVAPPADAATAARVEEIRAMLLEAGANLDTGRYAIGLDIATSAYASALELRYDPLIAEAGNQLGALQMQTGDYTAGRASFEAAYFAAERSGHAEAALLAASMLVQAAVELADLEGGRRWTHHAQSWLQRSGAGGEPEALLSSHIAALEVEVAGNPAVARERLMEALRIRESVYGLEHPRVATSLTNLGIVARVAGSYDESVALQRRALAIRQRDYGPEHPIMAQSHNNLANALLHTGAYEESLVHQQRALELWTAALGPDHPDVGSGHANLGFVLARMGRTEEALRHFERALVIAEATFGPDHPHVAAIHNNIASTLRQRGDLAGARTHQERALVREKALGADHPDVAASLLNLGNIHYEEKHWALALDHYERALTIFLATLGDRHPYVATAHTAIGQCLFELDRAGEAVPHFERALEICESGGGEANLLGETSFGLARALWAIGRERERALVLAEQARSAYGSAGPAVADPLAAVESWLAERRPRRPTSK